MCDVTNRRISFKRFVSSGGQESHEMQPKDGQAVNVGQIYSRIVRWRCNVQFKCYSEAPDTENDENSAKTTKIRPLWFFSSANFIGRILDSIFLIRTLFGEAKKKKKISQIHVRVFFAREAFIYFSLVFHPLKITGDV